MNIAAMPPIVHPSYTQHAPEAKEGSGPDHDSDSDNTASVSNQPKPSTPIGMGASVDKTA